MFAWGGQGLPLAQVQAEEYEYQLLADQGRVRGNLGVEQLLARDDPAFAADSGGERTFRDVLLNCYHEDFQGQLLADWERVRERLLCLESYKACGEYEKTSREGSVGLFCWFFPN